MDHDWRIATSPLFIHDTADDGDDVRGAADLAVGVPVQQMEVTHPVGLSRLVGSKEWGGEGEEGEGEEGEERRGRRVRRGGREKERRERVG